MIARCASHHFQVETGYQKNKLKLDMKWLFRDHASEFGEGLLVKNVNCVGQKEYLHQLILKQIRKTRDFNFKFSHQL